VSQLHEAVPHLAKSARALQHVCKAMAERERDTVYHHQLDLHTGPLVCFGIAGAYMIPRPWQQGLAGLLQLILIFFCSSKALAFMLLCAPFLLD
jgi:hypothetical protein